MKRIFLGIILLIVLTGIFLIRFPRHRMDHLPARREEAANSAGDISIAVVWPKENKSFLRGVQLALEEVNAAGGVPIRNSDGSEYNSSFHIRFFDEPTSQSGIDAAKYLARDRNTLVAVGHENDSAIRASIIYNASGVLYLAPTALSQTLAQHGFGFVFRMAPDQNDFAQAMVEGLSSLLPSKHIRVAILYPERPSEGSSNRMETPVSTPTLGQEAELDLTELDIGQQFTEFANALLEPHGDRIRIEVVLAQAYAADDISDETTALLSEHVDLYDAAIVLDVLPVAENLIKTIESNLDGQSKLLLSLEDLDWSQIDHPYAKFSPALGMDFYEPVVHLLLNRSKQNIAIIASRDPEGISSGNAIWSALQRFKGDPNRQVDLAIYRSFKPGTQDFSHLVSEIEERQIELAFLAGSGEDGARLLTQVREAGLEPTIVCGPDFEAPLSSAKPDAALDGVRETVQKWLEQDRGKLSGSRISAKDVFARLRAEGYRGSEVAVRRLVAENIGGTFLISTYDATTNNGNVMTFQSAFRKKYGDAPVDASAAEGYQAIHLLWHAFLRSRTRSPKLTAEALKRFVTEGTFDGNRFSPQGELSGRPIYLNRIFQGSNTQG